MSQVTQIQLPTTGTISGLAYTQQLNQILEAIGTQNKGATAPQNPYTGMFWLDDSAAPIWVLKMYDASGIGTWRSIATIDTQNGTVTVTGTGSWARKNANIVTKSADYTVADTDDGKLIACDASTAAMTVTFPAASTVGDGFLVMIRKTDSGSNKVTVEASGAETIDGASTYDLLAQYSSIVLQSDGTGWHVLASHSAGGGGGGGLLAMVVFTSSGTYTKNTSASRIKVTVVGGGGGGGGGTTSPTPGRGGAAGGMAIKAIDNTSVASTETVTVGSGGAGGAAGGAGSSGGSSSFGSHCSATGGGGGASGYGQGPAGGTGTGGDINVTGEPGSNGNNAGGANGGNTMFGGGGLAAYNAGTGQNAVGYGAGGGGAWYNYGGGNGMSGIVIVEEYA